MIVHPRDDAPIGPELLDLLASVAPASVGHYVANGSVDHRVRAMLPDVRMLGRAATLRQPYPDALPMHVAFDHLRPGDVLVVDRNGDERVGCLGEMTVLQGKALGLAGFLVDGTITDIEPIRRIGLPIFARGLTNAATKVLNAGGAELFGPVVVGGVVVRTGDIILGDENGVLVLDHNLPNLHEIAQRAKADEEREVEWRGRISRGEHLSDLSGARSLMRSVEPDRDAS